MTQWKKYKDVRKSKKKTFSDVIKSKTKQQLNGHVNGYENEINV